MHNPHKAVLSATQERQSLSTMLGRTTQLTGVLKGTGTKQFIGTDFSFNYPANTRIYPTTKEGALLDNFSFGNIDDHTITTIQAIQVGENSSLEDFSNVKVRMMNPSYNSSYKKINNAICILFLNNTNSFEKSIFCIQKNKVISVVVTGQIMDSVSKDFDMILQSLKF